jgi:hypothetical protein
LLIGLRDWGLGTAGAYDRAFYSGVAILMALAVVAGFAPT